MDVRIEASTLEGATRAPPSKSYTHRALFAAGFGAGTRVEDPLDSADTRATARAVEAFGGSVDREGSPDGDAGHDAPTGDGEGADRPDGWSVTGFDGRPGAPGDVLDCGNSGTTMRLATAAAALGDGLTVLTGDDSLRSRPQGPLLSAVESLGGRAESTRGDGRAPLVVGGPVEGGRVSMPGDVSSQFVTALLMAGALTDGGIEVELETKLKSSPYVRITLEVLSAFGVDARETDAGFAVEGDQRYDPGETYPVPGDFSSASYLLAAGAVAAPGGLRVENLHPGPQGDRVIVEVLHRMGAEVDWNRGEGRVDVARSALSGVTVDVGDTPDLLPTVAALGAVAEGETRIRNCEHVRYKETDRVAAMATELSRMGAAVTERETELIVHGDRSTLSGTRVDGRGDHRIAMALSVAALAAEGTTTVAGGEHVAVSFPDFFEVLADLGADVDRDRSA